MKAKTKMRRKIKEQEPEPTKSFYEFVLIKGYDSEKKTVTLQNPRLGVSAFQDFHSMGTIYKIRFSDVPDQFWGFIDSLLGCTVRLDTFEYPKKKWYGRTPKRYQLIFPHIGKFWSDMV